MRCSGEGRIVHVSRPAERNVCCVFKLSLPVGGATTTPTFRLYERLRRPPSPSSVHGSLPVLAFGDLFKAGIATVGLNPSRREFLDNHGRELDGPKRRFETLGSLGARDRP